MSVKTQKLNTTVELEVLDVHSDSDTDNNHRCSSIKSENHKRYHRTTKRRKSKTQSCGSLCSFASYRATPKTEQISEPNVNYYVDSATGEIVDLNVRTKSVLRKTDSEKELKCCDDGVAAGCSYDAAKGKSELFGEVNGSPLSSTVQPVSTGFKASLITVLGKLGMWNKSGGNKSTRIPPQQDKGLPPGKGPPPSNSKYFRAFSFTGKLPIRL